MAGEHILEERLSLELLSDSGLLEHSLLLRCGMEVASDLLLNDASLLIDHLMAVACLIQVIVRESE